MRLRKKDKKFKAKVTERKQTHKEIFKERQEEMDKKKEKVK